MTKLALSIGRSTSIHSCDTFIMLTFACAAIIRPKVETELSIQDRHPTSTSSHLHSRVLNLSAFSAIYRPLDAL